MPTIEARLSLNPRRALDMLRQDRRLRRAAREMPKPVPWDWARSRLLPLLAGPYLGPDQLVTVVGAPGCAVMFGIEVARTFVFVDRAAARRWECDDALLERVAMANLDARCRSLTPGNLRHGTLAGHIVRVLDAAPWASSLLLVPDHLVRIFGPEDQLFGAPKLDTLLGFGVETPTRVAAHIVVDYEYKAAYPLLLEPFALVDGRVEWDGAAGDEEAWNDA